jgi:2-C-methyl-D-erythritol 2,4-cyclodiphosphate synthase
MMPYIPKMKDILCKILEISHDDISIKAKTKEKMDAVGQNLAIEANAVVLLQKS